MAIWNDCFDSMCAMHTMNGYLQFCLNTGAVTTLATLADISNLLHNVLSNGATKEIQLKATTRICCMDAHGNENNVGRQEKFSLTTH